MPAQISAYVVGYVGDVVVGEDIIRYLRGLDATLEPFGGQFIVQGGHLTALEGDCDGILVVIRFPDHGSATRWYESVEYQRILPLRVANSRSVAAIFDGVKADHTAASMVDVLRSSSDTGER